jgi:glycosyltransferase involved in cell wall biosynthesis
MNDSSVSICIIAHNAYGVLAKTDTKHAGGIEVQTPLMAKWLAKNGFEVSMVTWDEGIEDSGVIDGVRVLKLCKRSDGIRGLRFFHPRWTSYVKALKQANADIYYYNCGDLGLGQLAAWARCNKKTTVFSVASEQDCYQDLSHISSWRDRFFYKYGLRNADKVIVQTNSQKKILEREYGIESILVPMPCEGFSKNIRTPAERLSREKRVLWIGRLTREKRLELLLDVAERCSDIHFDVVGSENLPSQYAKEVTARAKEIKNVTLHGRVQHQDMGAFYDQATLLCSTSLYEGFPNVYLEAWSTGLPIVSTFDPDSVIDNNNIGRIAKDADSVVRAIRELHEENTYKEISKNALEYYREKHSVDASMKEFSDVFKKIAAQQ